MSEKCPFCSTSGNQDKVCDHYILAIWEEKFGDTIAAPVWMPLIDGSYAQSIKCAVDELFEYLKENPKVIQNEFQGDHLSQLLGDLKNKSEGNWQRDHDNFFEYVEMECNTTFNEYIIKVYHLSSDEDQIIKDTIYHSPGLEWNNIYLWSRNPEKTARKMIAIIDDDLSRVKRKEIDLDEKCH